MIAVIDYGLGNLRSIAKGLEVVGGKVIVTSDATEIQNADRIVLPGVGAFGDGMKNLEERGLIPLLEEEVLKKKKPLWGICLGMQLLAESSEEFGKHVGLGWVDAEVKKFAFDSNKNLKVPHVGWNTVTFRSGHPLTEGLRENEDFYFVHSYHFVPENERVIVGTCDYGGEFVACIVKENIFATQFHPEKSQRMGLRMLKNFLKWNI